MVLILDALPQRLWKFQRGGGGGGWGGGGAGWIIRSLFTWGNSIVEGGGEGKSVSLIHVQLIFKEKILS